ncbi:MAG TPA: helix-turn-helix domain-containing GNAT family N-acetyltransferase [Acidimicrobiales bacterium]|jgi:DNA-binding MarR family transcriptional regulator/GNAT superfamily N-acetyltransferase
MGTTAAADPPLADDVAAIRAFSRFYTGILGVLDEGLLETPYTLTEARLLYELAQQDDLEVVELRRSVGVDGGYLSRLLSRFHADGLIRRTRSVADGRRQVVQLTKKGRSAFEVLNGRSADQVGGMLASLDLDQRRRLVGAMNTIESLLGEVEPRDMVVLRPLGPGDHGWIVQRHGLVYAQEFGWDETFEGLVARIMADFVDERERDPKRVAGWIAEIAGEPVGCVLCVAKDATTAQLRLLLVDPMARGSGIGGRLIDECIRFARRAGYTRLVLWTNDVLTDARRLYDQAGFHLTEENPHHSFGHDLVGQTLALDL